MFPGMCGVTERLTRFMADKILRDACKRIGVEGVSTHSFRRTALTQMSSAGIPLRTIQEISDHSDLGTLQRYLEVTPDQKRKAVSVIGF
ncbi:MAG: tyrosine-type recombinase/integrase [Nostoc sp.]